MSWDPGGEKVQFGVARGTNPCASPHASREIPGAMRVQVKVNTDPHPPLHPPTWRHRELAASSPARELHCWRRAQQEVLEDWRGRATTAAGDTWERSELGELGNGLETLAMSWFLLRQPNLNLVITYLFCLDWHTLCVS